MAAHRAHGRHRAPTTPRHMMASSRHVGAAVLALAMLALLVSLYVAGSKAEDIPATTAPVALADQGEPVTITPVAPVVAPTLPLCSGYEIALADASHARGRSIRLACEDAESLGLPAGSVAADLFTV